MDIEGCELNALEGSDDLFELNITWIIEAHRSPQSGVHPSGFSSKNMDEIKKIQKRYSLRILGEDTGENNIHIVAQSDD